MSGSRNFPVASPGPTADPIAAVEQLNATADTVTGFRRDIQKQQLKHSPAQSHIQSHHFSHDGSDPVLTDQPFVSPSPSQMPSPPSTFRSLHFLSSHIMHTLSFYIGQPQQPAASSTSAPFHARCCDPSGGMFHCFADDGSVFDSSSRHLVSSTRFVVTFARACIGHTSHPNAPQWLQLCAHALKFVNEVHWSDIRKRFAWTLEWKDSQARVLDTNQYCYGLAFVLLAHAMALMAGIEAAHDGIAATFSLMNEKFWDAKNGLYLDAIDECGGVMQYRGQNPNMHCVEALLAAYQATTNRDYLERANVVAVSVTQRLASHVPSNLIWEHFNGDNWQPDWTYNKGDCLGQKHFRPWGFQPGHLVEWAKLLLQLEEYGSSSSPRIDNGWMIQRSQHLFDAAMTYGWDCTHGGLYYCFDLEPPHAACDDDKYHWVQSEAFAAAAMLARRTGEEKYALWYDRIWSYCWANFVDHKHGGWFCQLRSDNGKIDDRKSPMGEM